MLSNSSFNDPKLYSDIQGLQSLTSNQATHSKKVNKEVAEQFESMMLQLLINSMRSANKAFSGGLFEQNETASMYTDLYDKQLALTLSQSGSMGLSKQIQAYLDNINAPEKADLPNQSVFEPLIPSLDTVKTLDKLEPVSSKEPSIMGFDSPSDFVSNLWSSAKAAAQLIGTDPKILLAQAALETNWGKQIIHHDAGDSTHNLFNIKAGDNWKQRAASFNTIEQEDGLLTKQRAKFRSYSSYADSFFDYTNFLKQNSRYSEALQHASEPDKFIGYLQKARYATDEKYSEKIMNIYSSAKFNDLFSQLNLI